MHLERNVEQLRNELTDSHGTADSLVQLVRAHELKHRCEALYTEGLIHDAAVSLLELTTTVSEEAMGNGLIKNWLAGGFLRSGLEGST